MAQDDLAAFYGQYIECLNARDWRRLSSFVAADVVHNGRPLGLAGYREMLEQNYRDIPDLRFVADLVVADDRRIAARLRFDCMPHASFLSVPVNGKRVVFHEHAFYEVRAARIVEVLSVIDKAALEDQANAV